jgi:hypothetical protein
MLKIRIHPRRNVSIRQMESWQELARFERVGLSSRNADTIQVNEDGSYDVYFAPKPPKGKESNCIPTGEDFFLLFRLYGPESKDFYKTWMLGDFEKVE